ncbi:hypothetical protein I4U23_010916 [Adineta vaga]|nr:hypothetical protein I4U23_010916 [Adineta vaga]
MYVYGSRTDISSRSNWMKVFANNIRGLYCNTDDLAQQLAADVIKFYIEVANLAFTLREELHTLAAVCYKKSLDLLEIYSNDTSLQSTIYEKLMAIIVTLPMYKDQTSTSEHEPKEKAEKESFTLPGFHKFWDSISGKEPDFDEYIQRCPPIDVMNQLDSTFIWLDGQSQDSYVKLFDELISPKKWLRQESVTEYMNYIIDADDNQLNFILMSHNISESFFELFNEYLRACIILIYNNDEQIYMDHENSYSISASTSSTIIRCNNLQTARIGVLIMIAARLKGFGNKCALEFQRKRLAKEYYRKALEKLNSVGDFSVQKYIEEILEKLNPGNQYLTLNMIFIAVARQEFLTFNIHKFHRSFTVKTPIYPIKEIYGVEQVTTESHLLYIKVFGASFLQQKTFFHKECTLFAKVSLQTWGTEQYQDWSEIIDSAYTQDQINTMDPMWNEGFLFRVYPTKQRLLIEIYNVDRYFEEQVVSVCLIELNTEIPTESTTNVIRKRRYQLYENSAEFRVTGLATIGLLYINSSNFNLQEEGSEMEKAIVSYRVYNNWIRGGFGAVFDRPGIMSGNHNMFFDESCTILFADENNIPDDIEEITVVLLSDRFNCSVESHALIYEIKMMNCHLEVFNSIGDFKNYLYAVNNEKLILIVSDYFSELIFGFIDDLSAIQYIYILTTENRTHYHASWITNYSNIRGVFDNIQLLISQIKQDMSMLVENKEHSNIFESITQINMATTRSIYAKQLQSKCFHLLLQILVQTTPEAHTAKKRIAQYSRAANSCGEFNQDNERHLELVDEFENDYTANAALRWYTRESFVYRLLNKILRTNNVDAILDFGFYIADLHNGLKQLCSIQSENSADMHVYRGQYIKPDELRKIQLNVGGVIAINTFFSASSKLDVAVANSGVGSQRPLFESVLFDIQINKDDAKFHIFAKISKESKYENEDETLFTFGTSFHVNSIFFSNDNDVWIIKLTMANRKEQHLNDRFDVVLLHLVDILRHISSRTHTIDQKMLKRCRQYCANNEVELKKLDVFEANYRSDDAIRWYTKDSILFRLLNRALRSEDAEIVLDFRCFILDLYHQLDRIHTDFDRHTLNSQSYIVYRGQQVTIKEINRLKRNINGYIVIKTFLSTSLSEAVAKIFVGERIQRPVPEESLLFIIDVSAQIQCHNTEKPFGHIRQYSHMEDEEEVLFIPGTIFRLNAITKSANELWTAHLTLYTGNDEELNKLNNYQKLILSLAKRRQIKITTTNNQLDQ